MSKSVERKIQREIRDNERLAQRLDVLRARIKQKRTEDIARLRREEALIKLSKTPERSQPQGKERSGTLLDRILSSGSKRKEVFGRDFLRAAEHGNALQLLAYLDERFDVNYQDPETGETALHIAASCGARKALRVLVSTGFCDFLLRDRQDRLASKMAYLHGDDPVVARYLGMKEKEQARRPDALRSLRQLTEEQAPAKTEEQAPAKTKA